MAKIKIGKIPVYKGEYDNNTTYNRLNQVTYLGTTFQSIVDDNLGHPPAEKSEDGGEILYINTNYWDIIAKGIDNVKERTATDNSMGYKILKKNKSFAEQVIEENTIYEIRYDFTLTGDVTIPANCVLKFDGGSINSNGSNKNTIIGNNTTIDACLTRIFDNNIILSGTWNISVLFSLWFGIDNTGNTDVTEPINNLLEIAHTIQCGNVMFTTGKYKITSINITNKNNLVISGCGLSGSSIIGYVRAAVVFEVYGENSVGFDLSNSKGITIQNLTIKGNDSGATPKTHIFMSRHSDGRFNYHCNYNVIKNVDTLGWATYYSVFLNNAEINRFEDCVFQAYAKRAVVGISSSNPGITSPYGTTIMEGVSTTCNNFKSCDVLQYCHADDDFSEPACVYIEGGDKNIAFRDGYMRNVGYGEQYPSVFVIDESNNNSVKGVTIENIRNENGNHGGAFFKVINKNVNIPSQSITIRNCFTAGSAKVGCLLLGSIKDSFIDNIFIEAYNDAPEGETPHWTYTPESKIFDVHSVLNSFIRFPDIANVDLKGPYLSASIIIGQVSKRASFDIIGSHNCLYMGNDGVQLGNYIFDTTYNIGSVGGAKNASKFNLPKVTTAERPSPQTWEKGVVIFDSDLGIPIFWNGSKWIKADGTDAQV